MGGFPGYFLTAKSNEMGNSDIGFNMTLVGPQGLQSKLEKAFCFTGGMRQLRVIELSEE